MSPQARQSNSPHHVAAWMLAVVLLAGPVAAQADSSCQELLLTELGWRFISADGDAVEVHGGTPCDRADLTAAHAAGDLVVHWLGSLDVATRERTLRELLHHPAT